MLKSNAPARITVPFASSAAAGNIEVIPVTPGATPGKASMTLGFPPVTMEPIASGGVPPYGQDVNGILNYESVISQYEQAGYRYTFDATFASAVTGYPAGALLARSDGNGLWFNLADSNSTDPDSTSNANWVSVNVNRGSTSIAMVAGNVTPTVNTLGVPLLVLTGAPSSASNLILPLVAGAHWLVFNNTTGSGAIAVQGVTGTGVTIPNGQAQHVYTNGTNFYAVSSPTTGSYLPIDGTAVAATKLATARNFSITGDGTAAAVAFDGTANATLSLTLASTTVTAASYGNSTQVGQFTVDAKGRVTAASNVSINVPSALGYTPVQQGTGVGQSSNAVKIGWTGSKLKVTIDSTDQGSFALESGAQFTGTTSFAAGTTFGSLVGASNSDLSKHIALYGTTTGFCVTANRLNYNAPSGAGHYWVIGGTDAASLTASAFVATGTVRGGSDIRVKYNILPITHALDTVRRSLVGVTYNRRDQDGAFEAGFIADHVQRELPHLVGESELGEYKDFKSMDYMHTAAYLAAAITELEDRVGKQSRWAYLAMICGGLALLEAVALVVGR